MKVSRKIEYKGKIIFLKEGFIHPQYPFLKYCRKCKSFKNLKNEFTSFPDKQTGLKRTKPYCKECTAEIARNRYHNNEKVKYYHLEYNKKYKLEKEKFHG